MHAAAREASIRVTGRFIDSLPSMKLPNGPEHIASLNTARDEGFRNSLRIELRNRYSLMLFRSQWALSA
jgi:hypothetical protein